MDNLVHTATQGTRLLVSYGSGNGTRAAGARSRGRGGRQVAPGGAVRRVLSRANRGANQPGRGRRRRQQLLQEIQTAARRNRGGPRLSNRDVQRFTDLINRLLGTRR